MRSVEPSGGFLSRKIEGLLERVGFIERGLIREGALQGDVLERVGFTERGLISDGGLCREGAYLRGWAHYRGWGY